MKNINESENQLHDFLEFKKDTCTLLLLRPQGGNTIIEKTAVNLCEVTIEGKVYSFGGIRESFYDEMVLQYDWREYNVRQTKKTI